MPALKTIKPCFYVYMIVVPLKTFAFDVVKVTVERSGLFGWSSKVMLNRSRSQAKYFIENLGNDLILKMVSIPGGSFMMGAPSGEQGSTDQERTQHRVKIKPFFMGKFQVTQAQWRAVTSLPKVKHDLIPDPSNFKGDLLPVERVTWEDAVEFCARLSKCTGREYRLPSEAEWEYACRAGTTTPFHFGETITTNLANYNGNDTYANEPKGKYRKTTTPVGQFPPNAYGLYDMHCNVWEWCQDDWHGNYKDSPTDGNVCFSECSNKKVIRGGSWFNDPFVCRSAYRLGSSRDHRNGLVGFRVVCIASRTIDKKL